VASFRHFWQNVMEKENAVTNSLIFVQKTPKMKKKIAEKSPQLLQHERVLKIVLLYNIFEYRQIWLNTLMDDRHLSNITKLKKKKTLEFQRFRGSDSCYQQVGQTGYN
jgi:hypothetical protein